MKYLDTAIIIALFLSLATAQKCVARLPHVDEPEGRDAQLESLEEVKKKLDHAFTLPADQGYPIIGSTLRKLARANNYQVEERWPIYYDTQKRLIAIPGHAYFYRDLILKAKDRGFTNGQPANVPGYHDYTLERMYALETLSHLPSLETMKVLNGFLDDTGRPSGDPGDSGYFNDLALTSITTFRKLIEEDARKDHGMTWKQWRDAVRAGELTFHFKGSDVRYNFEGPVPEKKTRPQRPTPSGQKPSDPSSKTNPSSSSDLEDTPPGTRNTILALATLILLSSIAWWGYTKRKS